MGQVLVRNLEDDVIDQLKRRAKKAGTSLEDVARNALREAARPSREELLEEIDRIRGEIGPVDFDSTAFIREMRDRGWPRD